MLPPANPRIGNIVLAPQTLKFTEVQEIVTDTSSKNIGKNKTLQRISRTGVDGTTPVHIEISETPFPYPSDNSGTRIDRTSAPTFGISVTSEITESVLPHPLAASGALVLTIYGNPLPQISEILMN